MKEERAIFAGGCFWGMEHLLQKLPGVLFTQVGYTGGEIENPSYEQVCTGLTGHAEAVEIRFNPEEISYEELAKAFFEIHDPTQSEGQGPDLGSQYRSAIFYLNQTQKQIAEKLIAELREKGYCIVTEVTSAGPFFPAEKKHQKYYDRTGRQPYCHFRVKKF